MKASKCFWVALCLLVGNFSTELWAQKNLEAVVQKCKADKTIDKSVVTNKDPKTKKVYKIVSSFVVEGHAALQQEIKSAFERDKEEAYQVIENENDGVVRGRAMMRPMKPRMAPHTERERSKMAGLRPMALPMIFGVTTMSVIICTTAKTRNAMPNTYQKF